MGEFAGDTQYRGVERLKAYTQVSQTPGVTDGKFSPNYGTESRVEPSLSPYPYRGTLTNMLAPAAALGASIHHAGKKLDYDLGWFSSDYDPEFGSMGGDPLPAPSGTPITSTTSMPDAPTRRDTTSPVSAPRTATSSSCRTPLTVTCYRSD